MLHSDPYKPFLRVERFRLHCRDSGDARIGAVHSSCGPDSKLRAAMASTG